ncbi:MAG: hypothetical protein JOZ65_24640, partial [Chloroflexi bacterium]|nr:hypothetical protein [Chloroflexota bacterium]
NLVDHGVPGDGDGLGAVRDVQGLNLCPRQVPGIVRVGLKVAEIHEHAARSPHAGGVSLVGRPPQHTLFVISSEELAA